MERFAAIRAAIGRSDAGWSDLKVNLSEAVRGQEEAATSPEPYREGVPPFRSPEDAAEWQRILDARERAEKQVLKYVRALASWRGRPRDPGSKCSLCGQLEKQVRELISGPRVFICDECVEEAQRTMHAAADRCEPATDLQGVAAPRHYSQVSCTFCGKTSLAVRHLVGGETALICDECLDLCDAILGERFSGEWPRGIGDAKPLKQLRVIDRYRTGPFESATDLGVMSPEEAVSRARAAKMILCLNRAYGDVPVYSLVRADDELFEDDPLVIPRQTLTFRTMYSVAKVDARISEACAQLGHDNPCRIVILVDDGEADVARRLLDRVKMALGDVAEFREHEAALHGAALTAIAIPHTGSD